MTKLTVLYDLPPGADHKVFLRWRTGEHHEENMSQPGVLKSDFYAIQSAWRLDSPPYRYITESYFRDIETFNKSFFDPEYQRVLAPSIARIARPLFLISEEVLSSQNA